MSAFTSKLQKKIRNFLTIEFFFVPYHSDNKIPFFVCLFCGMVNCFRWIHIFDYYGTHKSLFFYFTFLHMHRVEVKYWIRSKNQDHFKCNFYPFEVEINTNQVFLEHVNVCPLISVMYTTKKNICEIIAFEIETKYVYLLYFLTLNI